MKTKKIVVCDDGDTLIDYCFSLEHLSNVCFVHICFVDNKVNRKRIYKSVLDFIDDFNKDFIDYER